MLGVTGGCDSSLSDLESAWKDYHARLIRVLGKDLELSDALSSEQVLAYPSPRDLRIALPQERIDLLDFLKLLDCGLNTLVAHRNSPLGRQSGASQIWAYEIQFVRQAPECYRHLDDKQAELSQRLRAVVQQKREFLPVAAWNALFAGEEFRHFLTLRRAQPLDLSAERGSELGAWLSEWQQWLTQTRQTGNPPLPRIEPGLKEFAEAQAGGRVLREILWISHRLIALNTGLKQTFARRGLCPTGKASEKARILSNVVRGYWAGAVQPELVRLKSDWERWAPAMNRLALGLTEALPASADAAAARSLLNEYREYYLSAEAPSLMVAFQTALREHAGILSDALASCGLAPGQNAARGEQGQG